jgi:translation initiation factor 1
MVEQEITNAFDEAITINKDPENKIHIRVQQRTARKMITIVQNLQSYLNDTEVKDLLKLLRKKLNTNGSLIKHPEFGEVMHLNGDQRAGVMKMLVLYDINKDHIQLHGF